MELYEYTKKRPDNGRQAVIHDYWADSLTDWLNTIDRYADQYAKDRSQVWHHGAVEQNYRFTRTDSLDQAREIARDGWTEGVRKMEANLAALSANVSLPDVTPAYSYDVGGMFPDVAAYCAGEIEHMVTPEPVDSQTQTVVHLVLPGSAPAKMDAGDLETYGAALLSVLDALQRSGRSVSVEWAFVADPNETGLADQYDLKRPDWTMVRTPVIEEGKALDLASVSFAFHPSMLRRLAFAVCGGRPELEELGPVLGTATKEIPEPCREPGKLYPPGPWKVQDAGKLRSVKDCAEHLHQWIEHNV